MGLRIVIGDANRNDRNQLKEMLIREGYLVVADCGHGRTLLQAIYNTQPDVIIADVDLPGTGGLEIAYIVDEQHLAPVILTGAERPWDYLEQAKASGAYFYLAKPFSETVLVPAVELAGHHFRRLTALQIEKRELQAKLEARKIVEKAKGLLISRKGYSEEVAYQYLRKLAMDKCVPIEKVAKAVVKTFK